MKDYIRVLHIGADNIGFGGRSTIAYNLAQHMDSEIIHNDFLAFKPVEKDYEKRINQKNGAVIRSFNDIQNKRRIIREIALQRGITQALKEKDYDIVHIHADHAWEALKTILIAKKAGVKHFYVHGHSTEKTKLSRLLKKGIIWGSQRILPMISSENLACSEAAALCMFGSKSDNFHIIKNGIVINDFLYSKGNRQQVRNELQVNKYFVLGTVARLSSEKNYFFLFKVFREVLTKKTDSFLVIVGDGPLRDGLEDYAKELGISSNIIFLGNRKDVTRLLQAFDVFILTSKRESFGIVNLEAQAAGLPSVVTDVVPIEVKQTEYFNFMSLEQPPEIWADKILEYVNYERYEQKGNIIDAEYDILNSANYLQDLYIKTIKG